MSRTQRIVIAVSGVLMALVLLLAALAGWLLFTGSGASFALNRGSAYLQDSCHCTISYRFRGGSLWHGLQLADLSYADQADNTQASLQSLAFSWQPWRLSGRYLSVTDIQIEGLSVRLQPEASADPPPLQQQDVSGWFAMLPLTLDVQRLQARNLIIQSADTPQQIAALDVSLLADSEHAELRLAALQLDGAEVSGRLSLSAALALDADLNWSLTSAQAYRGELHAGGNLQQLTVSHQLLQPYSIASQGTVSSGLFGNDSFAFDMRHEAELLPLDEAGVAALRLENTALLTRGNLQQIALTLSSGLQFRDSLALQLSGQGEYLPETGQLNLDPLTFSNGQMAASVSGTWQIADSALSLQWQLDNFSNSTLLSGLSFSGVAGSGALALDWRQGMTADISLENITGQLNNYPLSVEGALQMADSQLQHLDLQVNSGGNILSLEGAAADGLDIDWQLQMPDIARSWSSLHGSLNGRGSLRGSVEQPLLNGELAGQELMLAVGERQLSLSQLQVDVEGSRQTVDRLQVSLGMLSLTEGDGSVALLSGGSVSGNGNLNSQAASVTLVSVHPQLPGTLEFDLSGTRSDDAWNGVISRAVLQSSAAGDWRLSNSSTLMYSTARWSLGNQCWQGNGIELCLAAQADEQKRIDADLQLSALPLEWFNRAADKPGLLQYMQDRYALNMPDNIIVSGTTDLSMSVRQYLDGDWQSLALTAQPHELVFQVEQPQQNEAMTMLPERHRFALDAVQLSATGTTGQWQLESAFTISQLFEEQQLPALQGVFSGLLNVDRQQNLQGELSFEFSDLAWLETILPDLHEPGGSLQGTALISGTRSQPQLDAELQLEHGSFQLPEFGIGVSDVDLRLNSSQEEASLSVSAKSGDGQLVVNARMSDPLLPGRSMTADIKGENFQLVSSDELHLTVSPELSLSLDAGRFAADGRVLIPELDLRLDAFLQDAVSGAVNVSRDAVVLRPDESAQVYSNTRSIGLQADVTVALGEQVRISGYGLNAELGGELRLEQQFNRPLFAYGELGVKTGSYSFYGQTLKTDGGRMMFYGNVLNPVLDMKAYRVTSTAEVGVQLRGNINSLEGRLYSTPSLPDNEVLALLATGKSFNNLDDSDSDALLSAVTSFGLRRSGGLTGAIGDKLGLDTLALSSGDTYQDSSLGIGKYLTPDLMMRYEVGLFDSKTVLSIDYRLSERLKLEVKSGISQSVDFTYTVEKN